MRHITGESRQQATLLPPSLDDYVASDHPVRVIDAFVDSLDLKKLGFSKAETCNTGRKPYHPGDLLKLYIYGYLNQVRSSRRLEKECRRNLELLWLLRRLTPDFKTIADFRKNNGQAIRGACRTFIQFCQQADLLTGRLVAIDGSKFKAAASRDSVTRRSQLAEKRQYIDQLIDRYLQQLNHADEETQPTELASDTVKEALKRLQQQKANLDRLESQMDEWGRNQACVTEPEAKLMRSGRDGMIVGYNVQSAVDAETGLIVHHDVTDDSDDRCQLYPMAQQAKVELGMNALQVLADAGYSNGEQLAACEAEGITATLPIRRSINDLTGLYSREDFQYDADRDEYICPAGECLTYKTINRKEKRRMYTREGCHACKLKMQCTKSKQRWVSRHFHEDAFERCDARLQQNPDLMRKRMAIVERPFAILKQLMSFRRFLCWGMEGARSEMSLGILSYNLNRMINQQGVPAMLAALR
ncbi:MAG: IS1182 family transposase [Gammaproteobacteria bacterium]